jgi:hypothetical protein
VAHRASRSADSARPTRVQLDQRQQYLEYVLAAVTQSRIDQQPVVVLLDPCNGIANIRHRDHPHFRIHSESVAALWACLQEGDVLVVWQWPQPARIPAHNPIRLLAAAIELANLPAPAGGIQLHPFGPFVMLELQR